MRPRKRRHHGRRAQRIKERRPDLRSQVKGVRGNALIAPSGRLLQCLGPQPHRPRLEERVGGLGQPECVEDLQQGWALVTGGSASEDRRRTGLHGLGDNAGCSHPFDWRQCISPPRPLRERPPPARDLPLGCLAGRLLGPKTVAPCCMLVPTHNCYAVPLSARACCRSAYFTRFSQIRSRTVSRFGPRASESILALLMMKDSLRSGGLKELPSLRSGLLLDPSSASAKRSP